MVKERRLFIFVFVGSLLLFRIGALVSCNAIESLASPRGTIGVTTAYGIVGGIASFVWAFNWSVYTPVSAAAGATIQMSGGLVAAAASLAFGATVPLIIYYKYIKKHPAAPTVNEEEGEENYDEQENDDALDDACETIEMTDLGSSSDQSTSFSDS